MSWSCRLLRRAGRAAVLAEVEPSMAVALGAKRRAEDIEEVGLYTIEERRDGMDELWMVGWG